MKDTSGIETPVRSPKPVVFQNLSLLRALLRATLLPRRAERRRRRDRLPASNLHTPFLILYKTYTQRPRDEAQRAVIS